MARGSVGIVGAGLAGLSAGCELKRLGFRVEVIERSRLLGGKATSFTLDGVEVDNGQHVYLGCCTELIDFIEGVIVAAGIHPPPVRMQPRFKAVLLARGHAPATLRASDLPPPLHLATALLAYRNLPIIDRLRIGAAVLAASRSPRPGESFGDWLDRHNQSAAARRGFWDPFLVPALNARPEDVAAEAALFVIATAFLRDRSAARFGFTLIPLAHIAASAARGLDRVLTRTPVVALDADRREDGVPQVRGVVLDDGTRLAYDALVLAIPPQRLARLLGEPAIFGITNLDGFRHAAIVDVHLWYETTRGGFDFAAVLDSPVQWVFEKAPGYFCCSLSAADRYAGVAGDDLVKMCRAELEAVVPALAGVRFLRGAATRDREATFVPTPGLRRPGAATASPRLAIAGAWTDTGWPATMESAVRSGRAAARLLARNLDAVAD